MQFMTILYFSGIGATPKELPANRTQLTTYTIPIVDISKETKRQVVIARGTDKIYQGHPHTVLMDDNKTIFAVWTYEHGGYCGPMKKSTDGGLTWSELLPVPDNWKTVKNCPTIHRITDPDGIERMFVFAGNGDMYQSISVDDGETWTPFEPNGLHCVVVPISIVPISGDRHLAMYHQKQAIWQSISHDGGLTWEPERMIAEYKDGYPCEPAVIKSPDGKQLAAIMRENTRKYNSLLIVSDDDGETWSKPVELPASLTGDRHMPRYSHTTQKNGRLVITFRDTALGSPTRGDFVAWVGTYDDIVNLREGQYRVRLLDSPQKFDLGYPGLELLPDGTFVATTYAVLKEGEKNSVVSVRFKLDELDEKAAHLPCQTDLFVAGQDGYHSYRIPSVIVTTKGTVLAFCEGRRHGRGDSGMIDIVLKRSFDGGATWRPMQVVAEDGANTIGNPCPVVDRDTGTIWLLLTHNFGEDTEGQIMDNTSKGTRTVHVMKSTDDGETWSDLVEITETTKRPTWRWYATGPGVGIQLRTGRLVIPCDHSEHGLPGHPYRSHVIYSDDHGETWQLGGVVGEKVNECQVVELSDGSLCINMRSYHGENRRAVSISKDGGLTWSEMKLDPALIEPVCQASFIRYDKKRLLFSNPASTKREKMTVRVSYDDGETWTAKKVLHAGPSAYSCLTVLPDMTVGCFYERGEQSAYETITFARFPIGWLEDF